MPIIELATVIKAPRHICFDLARSIDLHKISTQHTNEEAIAGVTKGLISLHESVTWKARHFGIVQSLSTKITALDSPNYFVDEMINGAFKQFRHEHHFFKIDEYTKMIDLFDYESPFGLIGQAFDLIVLKRYMRKLLAKRNLTIKEFAETEKWKELLL